MLSVARMPLRWLSPAGRKGRLSTFIFHRVLPQPDPLLPDEPDYDRFDRIVAFIASHFRVMPLSDAADALARGTLPAAAACITFDDGYADNLTVAVPVLRQHGVSATFFIATSFIDGGRMWNDTVIEAVRGVPDCVLDWRDLGLGQHDLSCATSRVLAYRSMLVALKHLPVSQRGELTQEIGRRAGLPAHSDLMLTRDQLVALRNAGMDIGGHTMTHPILSKLDDASARNEIGGGREQLAAWLGEPPTVFAYPNGVPSQDYGDRDVALVRGAGFQAAVSTARGTAGRGVDVFQIPRFTPWDQDMLRFGARVALNLITDRMPRIAA